MDSRSRHAAAKLTSAFSRGLLRSRGDHLRSRITIQAARPSVDGLRASPICLFETLRHASSIDRYCSSPLSHLATTYQSSTFKDQSSPSHRSRCCVKTASHTVILWQHVEPRRGKLPYQGCLADHTRWSSGMLVSERACAHSFLAQCKGASSSQARSGVSELLIYVDQRIDLVDR